MPVKGVKGTGQFPDDAKFEDIPLGEPEGARETAGRKSVGVHLADRAEKIFVSLGFPVSKTAAALSKWNLKRLWQPIARIFRKIRQVASRFFVEEHSKAEAKKEKAKIERALQKELRKWGLDDTGETEMDEKSKWTSVKLSAGDDVEEEPTQRS